MFYYLCQQFYGPFVSVEAYTEAKDYTSCARKCIKLQKHATDHRLFSATEPLAYVSRDILGPLLKSSWDNAMLLLITGRFTNLSKTVALRKTTTHEIAEAFKKHWGFPYGPPSKPLSNIGKQFPARFSQMCVAYWLFPIISPPFTTHRQIAKLNDSTVRFLSPYGSTSLTLRSLGTNWWTRLHVRTIVSRAVALGLLLLYWC